MLLNHFFTFHYVSINTYVKSFTEHGFVPLHSIMFLLIPNKQYTYLKDYKFFTFHYVSINTELKKKPAQRWESLHSIMFLLIRLQTMIAPPFDDSLHSIMFLLILIHILNILL